MISTNNSNSGFNPEQINQTTKKKSFWKKYRFLFIYTILILLLLCESRTFGFFDIILKISLLIFVWIQAISSIQQCQKLQIPIFIGSSFIRQLIIIVSTILIVFILIVFTILMALFIFGKEKIVEEFEFIFEVFSLSMVWAVFCIYLLFKWKWGFMLFKGSFMAKLVVLALTGLILYMPVVITNIAVGIFLLEGDISGSGRGWDDD